MHLLQSPYWQTFKSQFNWAGRSISLPDCTAPVSILFRRLPLGLNFAYVPKGPTINWQDNRAVETALRELKRAGRQRGTFFLKVEPDAAADPAVTDAFRRAGFTPGRTVQPQATVLVNIALPEETILAEMKPKCRYNIRLAQKKGVTVRPGTAEDVAVFYRLSLITGNRDGFGIHPPDYYRAVFESFPPENRALLLACYADEPLAGLMVFAWQGRAYYLYGASGDQHRNLMPAYLLQWEAIRWAKAQNCAVYDLWGIPNAPLETLEAEFEQRNDGLWGVYRFKRGFGGAVAYSAGAFDFVYHRPLYALFTRLLESRSA